MRMRLPWTKTSTRSFPPRGCRRCRRLMDRPTRCSAACSASQAPTTANVEHGRTAAHGNCYDGGNGVISERALLTLYRDAHVEDMTRFDAALLDRRSYGLGRAYPECPNYSDDLTRRLIDRHLAMIPVGR